MQKGFTRLEVLVVLIIFACFVFITIKGVFIDEEAAVKVLEVYGFRNIKIIDHAWFLIPARGGDIFDSARFTAFATNLSGQEIEMRVFLPSRRVTLK